MKTTTIYANHGVLAHEYETVWGVAPVATADVWDEVTVGLPEGYSFRENAFGEPLVMDDATGSCAALSASLAKVADEPFVYFPDDLSWHKVPLTVVAVGR